MANQKRRRKLPETRKRVIEKLRQGWSPQGGKLYRLLKRFGKRKQRLGDRDYTTPLPGRVGIEERPAIVDERSRLGDHEGDLIVGYRQSGYVLSVLDRKSKKAVLRKLKSKHMEWCENRSSWRCASSAAGTP